MEEDMASLTRIAAGMQGLGTAPCPLCSPQPPRKGRTPGAGSPAGGKGDMHKDPALLPWVGKGGEGEEEEEEGLQQHLSSSGWSHRLGRCTGTPLVLGISGIT